MIYLVIIVLGLKAQQESFKSKHYFTFDKQIINHSAENDITFYSDRIVITKLYNNTDDLLLMIDSIVIKDYRLEGSCKWYYCKNESEAAVGLFNSILIVPIYNRMKKIVLYDIHDEVTINSFFFYY